MAEAWAEAAEEDLNHTVQDALRDLQLDGPSSSQRQYPPLPESLPNSPTMEPGSRRGSGLLRRKSVASPTLADVTDYQDYHIDLSSFPPLDPLQDGWRPIAAFALPGGGAVGVTRTLAFSDVGFLAASAGPSLILVDLRRNEVLCVETATTSSFESTKGKGKHGARTDTSPVTALSFTISPCGEDHDRTPRLIVVQASGATRVLEIGQVAGDWLLSEKVVSFSHGTVAGAFSTFVFDKYGNTADAAPMQLQQALNHQNSFSAEGIDAAGSLTGLWVTVTPTALACYANISGARTAVWLDKEAGFQNASIVHRLGSPVLLVSTVHRTVMAFALPDLQNITRLTFPSAIHTSAGAQSISADGDLVQVLDPLTIRLWTAFDNSGRPGPPRLELWTSPTIPAPPGTVTNGLKAYGTWLLGSSTRVYLPSEVEAILGGPNRKPAPVRNRAPPVLATASPTLGTTPTASVRASPRPEQARRIQQTQATADSAQSYLARANEALAQRGQYLNQLQEGMSQMGKDAEAFAKASKNSAAKAASKQAFSSGWSVGMSTLGKKLGM